MRRSWLAVLLLLGACTGPVRSTNVYESKAGATAETVASAVETARLAVDAGSQGKAFGRYLTQVLAEASEDADAAQGTFDAIQPPARRGQTGELAEPAAPLAGLAERLHAFAEAHA